VIVKKEKEEFYVPPAGRKSPEKADGKFNFDKYYSTKLKSSYEKAGSSSVKILPKNFLLCDLSFLLYFLAYYTINALILIVCEFKPS